MNCGSEDGRPRDVQNTRERRATEGRNRLNEKKGHEKHIYVGIKVTASLPVLVCDITPVVKGQHVQDGHGNDTVGLKKKYKLTTSTCGCVYDRGGVSPS